MNRTSLLTIALAACTCIAGSAQTFRNNTDKTMTCQNSNNGNSDRVNYCEIREYPGPAVSKFTVDPGMNGGVQVKGWDRSDTLVRAKVQTWGQTDAEAKGNASQVTVQAAGGNVSSSAPDFGNNRGWAVSYEIFVPHQTALDLKAHNGGVSVSDVAGDMNLRTVNGGLHLARIAGNVTGTTQNGGVKVELDGARWEGNQLDLTTSNGGVNLTLPDNYSAHLETSTVNGGVNVDYPMTVPAGKLRLNKEIKADIGSGGPMIRLKTTNGGVKIQRKAV